MSHRKAQSAIEYLMTYGWMLLVVAVVGGAVFSIVQGQGFDVQTSGFQQVEVQDIGINDLDGSELQLRNAGSDTTELREIRFRNSDSEEWMSAPINVDISQTDAEIVSIPQIRPVSDAQNEIEIELVYNRGNLEGIVSRGTLNGEIKVDDSLQVYSDRFSMDTRKSLVGYWPLTTDYTDQDTAMDLAGLNHGSVEGAEIDGRGLFFQEDDTVEVSDSEELDITESITMSAFVRPIEYNSHTRFVSKGNYNSYHLRFTSDSVVNFFCGEQDEDCGDDRKSDLSTGSEVTLEEWMHIATTWDGETTKIFVNGTEVASGGYDNGPLMVSENPLRIRSVYEYEGHISEVYVFNTALNETEIENLYEISTN